MFDGKGPLVGEELTKFVEIYMGQKNNYFSTAIVLGENNGKNNGLINKLTGNIGITMDRLALTVIDLYDKLEKAKA